jgi:type II secretory pathway pseudopilin PulG
MSAAGATTAPLRRAAGAGPIPAPRQPRTSAPARSRTQLSLVAPRATVAGRTPFAVLVAVILMAGLMALLLVHTLAAQDAFRVHDLNQRLAALKDTEQQLAVSTEQAASPTALRARAEALGMQPSQIDGYRHTKDGRVVGTLTAVPQPVVAPAPATAAKPATIHKPAGRTAKLGNAKSGTAKSGTAKSGTAKSGTATASKAAKGHGGKGHTGASHN